MMRCAAVVCLFAVACVVCGCASATGWSYRPEPLVSRSPAIQKGVAVIPLTDMRPNQNHNWTALSLIPLVPYGQATFEVPESEPLAYASGVRPTEDIAKAIADELRNTGLFKEAFFTFRESDADLVLRGELCSLRYVLWHTHYGLSVPGDLLWLIGFPVGGTHSHLNVRLLLEERQTKKVVWTHTIDERAGSVLWLYYMRKAPVHSVLLKKGMLKALPTIAPALMKAAP